jgi:hypothetical protein
VLFLSTGQRASAMREHAARLFMPAYILVLLREKGQPEKHAAKGKGI